MSHKSTPRKATFNYHPAYYPTPPTPTADLPAWRAGYTSARPSVSVSVASDPQALDIISYQSRHYPADDPHLHYDMREAPSRAMLVTPSNRYTLSPAHLAAPITLPGANKITIISKLFPWEIIIVGERGGVVTLSDLIGACHENLERPVTQSEWWIVSDRVRDRVTAAFNRNTMTRGVTRARSGGVRRIDWLRHNVILKGLEKDEEFIAKRIPDVREHANTWVMVTEPF